MFRVLDDCSDCDAVSTEHCECSPYWFPKLGFAKQIGEVSSSFHAKSFIRKSLTELFLKRPDSSRALFVMFTNPCPITSTMTPRLASSFDDKLSRSSDCRARISAIVVLPAWSSVSRVTKWGVNKDHLTTQSDNLYMRRSACFLNLNNRSSNSSLGASKVGQLLLTSIISVISCPTKISTASHRDCISEIHEYVFCETMMLPGGIRDERMLA